MANYFSARLTTDSKGKKNRLFINISKEHAKSFALEKNRYFSVKTSNDSKSKFVVKFYDTQIPMVTQSRKVGIYKDKDVVVGAYLSITPENCGLSSADKVLGMSFPFSIDGDSVTFEINPNHTVEKTPVFTNENKSKLGLPESSWGTDVKLTVPKAIDDKIQSYFKMKYCNQ